MKRDAFKWAILGGAIVFIVLYGIEMASSGIDNIYGPVEGGQTSRVTETLPQQREVAEPGKDAGQPLAASKEFTPAAPEQRLDTVVEERNVNPRENRLPVFYGQQREPGVNRLAESTGGLLQSISSGGIRFIVSLFDSITE
ncbi:hypothetical protein EBB07_33500 [Paenibacillaceae bacterium]|nr:hypothetical protein EBB07_33500 [Paenibacillaceae bacterium]